MRRLREIPCRMLVRIVRLYVRAVSVFGKKSDAVCGFLAKSVWFCGFRTPLHPPPQFYTRLLHAILLEFI